MRWALSRSNSGKPGLTGRNTIGSLNFASKEEVSYCFARVMKSASIFSKMVVMLASWLLAGVAASAFAAPSPVYRMTRLEEVKKRAAAEGKPIAWIGTFGNTLEPYNKLMDQNSHAATAYAIRALQNDTILITSDSGTENHQEPAIVDHELHTPNPHYTAPVVVILTPSMEKVIAKILYIAESKERIRVYTDVLKKIHDKSSWQETPADKNTSTNNVNGSSDKK